MEDINEYGHVTKCCECNKWIFFNDADIKIESIGGRIVRRLVWCKECKTEVPLYPWRCL